MSANTFMISAVCMFGLVLTAAVINDLSKRDTFLKCIEKHEPKECRQ